jgi:O-antigen/teichoic acid export membrane protein
MTLVERFPWGALVSRSPLRQRVWRAVVSFGLGAIGQTVGQLLLVPVALAVWGSLKYGEWVIVSGFFTFMTAADLGLQTHAVNCFKLDHSRSNLGAVVSRLNDTLKLQLLICLAVLAMVLPALFLLPLGPLAGMQTISGSELRLTCLCLCLEVLVGVPMGVVAGLYRATGHVPRSGQIGACQRTLAAFFTLAAIPLLGSFLAVAGGRLLIAMAGSTFILFDVRRLLSWLSIRPASGSIRSVLPMLPVSLIFLGIPLAEYLSSQVILQLVQQYMSGIEVSRLATHRTSVNMLQMASNLFQNAVWPEFTALYAVANWPAAQSLLRSASRANIVIVCASAIGLVVSAPVIYPIWTGRSLSLDGWVLALLVARAISWSYWSVSSTALMSINKHASVALVFLLGALVTCLLAAVLIPIFRLKGASAAILLGDMLPLAAIPRLAKAALLPNPVTVNG